MSVFYKGLQLPYKHRSFEAFPGMRMRRRRKEPWIRNMVAEYAVTPRDLILPVFICEGKGVKDAVPSMPGVFRYSIDEAEKLAKEARSLGVSALAIFPVVDPSLKDDEGTEAIKPNNLECRSVTALKNAVPEMGVICDVALDPYTLHGHDGIVSKGCVDNDRTVEMLNVQALLLAKAGCDVVAPSDMMDGRVGAIRKMLEDEGYLYVSILSYAAKYASSFYGPYREAIGSALNLGGADKRTYQMDYRNAKEALEEVILDINEGADIVMVKPGMPYLDVIKMVSDEVLCPVFAYQVSGEYAMLKHAIEQGWMHEDVMMESLIAFKRAGASAILTYSAIEIAQQLNT